MLSRPVKSGHALSAWLAIFCAFSILVPSARAIYYWDGNGSAAGAGNAPSGTWDATSPNWSDNGTTDNGSGTPAAYPQDSAVAFSNGGDATGAYTITVSTNNGSVTVRDMHFDDGTVTIVGAPLLITHGSNLISVLPDHVATVNVSLRNPPSTTDAFHKYKLGTLILGGTNTYSGATTIEGGVLQLGGNNRLPSTTRLILGNGGTDSLTDTPPTFATGGFNQNLATLAMTGPTPTLARTIDFGNGNSTLQFADSHLEDWSTDTLTITNFTLGQDKLRFGVNGNGLSASQVSQIAFADYANAPGVIDNAGYVLPNLPKFLSAQLVGQPPQIAVTWTALNQRTYRLESRNDFSSGWNFVGDYASNAGTITVNDTPNTTARFYRVTLVP
ncbi:MAG: Autotransporter-associated beta strand repeat protein [Verrucomicrobiales bacterium]|nr:Autotransporter-associated beta strand repeat protein [Verrucomicrobiales bacterium]